jgi:hypothetical protein
MSQWQRQWRWTKQIQQQKGPALMAAWDWFGAFTISFLPA